MGMASALVVPYLSMDGNVPSWMQDTRERMLGPAASAPQYEYPLSSPGVYENVSTDLSQQVSHLANHWLHTPHATNNVEMPLVPLEEVLRNEIQPAWVLSRWPQVSTVVAEMDMSGFRVPLITGNQPHDIVGSLTYYFDKQQRLRRIEIIGNTSDERYIVTLATQLFGLKPEASLQNGLYVQRWNREPLSVLQVELAAFLSPDATTPTRRVHLEINRSLPNCRLSEEMKQRLQAATGGA
jgi:hypothetical protein